jgi:LysM repeat protein
MGNYMKNINERMSELSKHLQTLSTPEFSSEIQVAAESKNKDALIKVCDKAKIPEAYVGTIVSAVLSVSPQKYPLSF